MFVNLNKEGQPALGLMQTFSPPSQAIMNAVSTPQLQPTSVTSSPDFDSFNSRAHSGYAPLGEINPNFKIDGE